MSDIDTPDYVAPSGPERDSSPRRGWLVTLVAVPVVIAVLALVISRLNEEHPPAKNGLAVPEAPTDGMASRLLDVRVSPDSNLVDGQQITVTGSGFPPGKSYAVLMCTNQARVQGVNACDINTSTGFTSGLAITEGDGTLTDSYVVHRYITVGGQSVDCMSGNVNPDDYAQGVEAEGTAGKVRPDGFTCIIAAALLDDYDQSGGWPISFAGAEFVTPVPTVIVPPSTASTEAPSTEPPGTATQPTGGSTITATVPSSAVPRTTVP